MRPKRVTYIRYDRWLTVIIYLVTLFQKVLPTLEGHANTVVIGQEMQV